MCLESSELVSITQATRCESIEKGVFILRIGTSVLIAQYDKIMAWTVSCGGCVSVCLRAIIYTECDY